MTFREFLDRKWGDFVSEAGRPPTPEEYASLHKTAETEWDEIEKQRRERRLAEMEQLSERLLEFASNMEACAHTDDLDGCHEALKQVGIVIMKHFTTKERQEIMENFNAARPRTSNSSGLGYKTPERIAEEDPNVLQSSSSLYGLIKRKRNSSADRGKYAGEICLSTRHGWRPIVVPGGAEAFLRKIGIWYKYGDELTLSTTRVPFQVEDRERFQADWERLEDGTRSLVKFLDTETGSVVWSKDPDVLSIV